MSDALPPIGTRAVPNDQVATGKGPVVEVYGHKPAPTPHRPTDCSDKKR
jgi:hypothetical protein